MAGYFLVDHDDWDESRKIFDGPNSNSSGLSTALWNDTIGRSPHCRWTLPDASLPDIVAFLAHSRYRRNFICELYPEDYGSIEPDDFVKRKPVLHKVVTSFEVAGYRFHSRYDDPVEVKEETAVDEDMKHPDRLRAAYIKTWDGHMSPGDFAGYARDEAAHTAWKNGEDVYEIIRKEREGRK